MTTNPVLIDNRIDEMFRARVIVAACILAAIIAGAFAAAIAIESASVWLLVGIFALAALILPRAWIPLALAMLIPLQFYFPVASGLNLRGAIVFVFVAALRFLFQRIAAGNVWRWSAWMLPAALFIVAASVSGFGAANRYAAFKGIYDWLAIFAAAFVVGQAVPSERWGKRLIAGLVIAGFAEAMLGIAQSFQSVDQIAQWLQRPFAGIVYQPNLLRDRLVDLSFNWVLDGRVIPFGTFINAIDYAILLAAILPLGLALMIAANRAAQKIFWALASGTMLVALLLTFKGSGILALAGALMIFAFVYARRLDARALGVAAVGLLVAGVAVAAFSAPLVQRVTFLAQREMGLLSDTGRIAIWSQLLDYLPQRPFFGFGINNLIWLIEPISTSRGGEFALVLVAPESLYLATLVETGVVGFLAFAVFIVAVLARALSNLRDARASAIPVGLLAALGAIFAGNLTAAALLNEQTGLLFGGLIGIVFAHWRKHHV